MSDVHMKSDEFFSIQLLADILSVPKRSIEGKVKNGLLVPNHKTGLIDKEQVKHLHEIKLLDESSWEEESKIKPNRQYNLVELFAGGGGLAIGMEKAGLKAIFLNEQDKHACNTLRHNRPNWNVVEGDIAQVDFTQIKDEYA